jgi:hypothetical protein
MSQTSHEPQRISATDESLAALRAPLPPPEQRPSPTWQNWAYFGAAIMAVMGLLWAVLGLIALVDEEHFVLRTNRLLAFDSYAPWGWAHLLGGLLAVAAGAGLLWGGHRWARIAAIVVATLSAVVNLGFLTAAPVWATTMIALDVMVIYALTVHGWEIDER